MSQVVERLAALGVTCRSQRRRSPITSAPRRAARCCSSPVSCRFGADGKLAQDHIGKLGPASSVETGAAAARQCAINVLAQAQAALGDLDRIVRVVRLGGFFAVDGRYDGLPQAMNGASDLMAAAFGEGGRHARTTVGVAFLPLGSIAEVEALFEIAS